MAITPGEGPNQSKTSCLVFTWDWSHRLVFPPILLQIFDDTTSIEVLQEGGEALRFVLVNTWHHGSMTRTSWRACNSYSERRHLQWHTTTILSTWLNNKKSGARWRSWEPDSRTRSATHNDDWLQVPSEPQKLSDHVSSGGQATSYDRSDRWSDTTTDRNSIDGHPIF
jgi:hypothetical protein